MSLKAVTWHILVSPDETEKKSAGGIDLSALDHKAERNAQTTGVVVNIGEDAFAAYKPKTPYAGIQVGDRVHYPKYSGKWVRDSKTFEEFLAINDEDIIVVERSDVDPKLAS